MAREIEILRAAIARSRECETCAAAMIIDGRCPVHRIQYQDGRKVPQPKP